MPAPCVPADVPTSRPRGSLAPRHRRVRPAVVLGCRGQLHLVGYQADVRPYFEAVDVFALGAPGMRAPSALSWSFLVCLSPPSPYNGHSTNIPRGPSADSRTRCGGVKRRG